MLGSHFGLIQQRAIAKCLHITIKAVIKTNSTTEAGSEGQGGVGPLWTCLLLFLVAIVELVLITAFIVM